MAWGIGNAIDNGNKRFQVRGCEGVMAGVKLHRSSRRIEIIVVRRQSYPPVVDKLVALLLQKVYRHDIRADVLDGDSVDAAVAPSIPVPDVGQGQTDRKLARASRRIKELDENDFARKVPQPHGCVVGEAR